MAEFIRVLGDDPHYKGRKTYLLISPTIIWKAYPVWAEEKGGQLYRCTEDHKGAKIVSYILVDTEGNEYSCGNRDELSVLGIPVETEPRPFGFVTIDEKNKETVDLIQERAGG
jgi:hypothetical protein